MLSNDLILVTRPSFGVFDPTTPYEALEEKYDGWRITIIRRNRRFFAFSKKTSVDLWPKVARNHEVREAVMSLPDNSVVDGEAYIPDGLSSDVPTALTTGEGWSLRAFALPYLKGMNLKKMSIWSARGLLSEHGFNLTNARPLGGPNMVSEECLKSEAKKIGIEGWVLKLQHYLGWVRVKPKKTADLVVMGKYEGNNRHTGRLGGFNCGLRDEDTGEWVIVADCGGGFSDEQRNEFWTKDVIGRVCEVEYDSLTSHGRLRFPQFIRWREDKEPESCILNQLE